jgi:hypothetical protein
MLSKTRSEIDIDRGDKRLADISFVLASDTLKEDAEIVNLVLAVGQLMASWKAAINTRQMCLMGNLSHCSVIPMFTNQENLNGLSFILGAGQLRFDYYKSVRSTGLWAWS